MLKRPLGLVLLEDFIELINAGFGNAVPEQGELENVLVRSDDLPEHFGSLDVDIVALKVDLLDGCKVTANDVLVLEEIAV